MRPPLTILLADDDFDDAFVFQEVIKEIDPGISFVHKKDGKEALSYLNDCQTLPDLLFLDLNMPRLSGKESLHMIKQNEALSSLPVIMYTTSSQSADIEEAIIGGASGFITKPSSIGELRQIIASIINSLPNDLLKTLRGLSNNSLTFIVSA